MSRPSWKDKEKRRHYLIFQSLYYCKDIVIYRKYKLLAILCCSKNESKLYKELKDQRSKEDLDEPIRIELRHTSLFVRTGLLNSHRVPTFSSQSFCHRYHFGPGPNKCSIGGLRYENPSLILQLLSTWKQWIVLNVIW